MFFLSLSGLYFSLPSVLYIFCFSLSLNLWRSSLPLSLCFQRERYYGMWLWACQQWPASWLLCSSSAQLRPCTRGVKGTILWRIWGAPPPEPNTLTISFRLNNLLKFKTHTHANALVLSSCLFYRSPEGEAIDDQKDHQIDMKHSYFWQPKWRLNELQAWLEWLIFYWFVKHIWSHVSDVDVWHVLANFVISREET